MAATIANDRSSVKPRSRPRRSIRSMRLFAPALAFVDLETTGTARRDRRASPRSGSCGSTPTPTAREPLVNEWRTLVDPGRADPAGDPGADRHHQRDGARRAVVRADRGRGRRAAPPVRCSSRTTRASTTAFSSTRSPAPSARFSARVLCTVRLSRRLFPDEPSHSLDSVIARHGLPVGRSPPRARRRARAVGVRARAVPRTAAGGDRRRGRSGC